MFTALHILTCAAALTAAAATDTLQTVTVVADRGVVVSRADTLSVSNSSTITDVLSKSPGLQVSDNGGYSGLKTVSLRGLGSPHTAIYVDGVRIGDIQSGQYDLGILDLDNFGRAVVDYAQNSVSFLTAKPTFKEGRRVAGDFKFSGGSFSTFLPSGRLDFRLSDNVSLSAHASGIFSKGDYTCPDGAKRANNDIRQVKAGADLFGYFRGGDWMAKLWYNGSDRGTPGSVSWPSDDRQTNKDFFVQGYVRNRFNHIYTLNLSAKASYDYIFYKSAWGDSDYRQTELQLNSSHKFHVCRWLDLSAAADIQWDGLRATYYDKSRTGVVAAAGAALRFSRFSANVAVEYNGVFDNGEAGRGAVSPSVDFRVDLMQSLYLTGFARRAYRIPTFNELYYPGYGNPELEAEDAQLTDLGLFWNRQISKTWSVKASLDGFFNLLKNKITSAPTPADPSIWAPYNIGKVRTLGFDLNAGTAFDNSKFKGSLELRYSLQNAIDKTPGSATLNRQIPYVARNTFAVNANAAICGFSADIVWNFRGGRSDSYGDMGNMNTLDVCLAKAFELGKANLLILKLTGRNLTNCRYELTSGYPMPGTSVMGGIEFKF